MSTADACRWHRRAEDARTVPEVGRPAAPQVRAASDAEQRGEGEGALVEGGATGRRPGRRRRRTARLSRDQLGRRQRAVLRQPGQRQRRPAAQRAHQERRQSRRLRLLPVPTRPRRRIRSNTGHRRRQYVFLSVPYFVTDFYCVWSGITGRISLQTTVIDDCHKHVCIYIFVQ